MEKILWAGIALLWLSLVGSAAIGSESKSAGQHDAVIVSVASTGAGLVTPVVNTSVDRVLRPTVSPGERGGSELAGAALIGVACLVRAARRRHLI